MVGGELPPEGQGVGGLEGLAGIGFLGVGVSQVFENLLRGESHEFIILKLVQSLGRPPPKRRNEVTKTRTGWRFLHVVSSQARNRALRDAVRARRAVALAVAVAALVAAVAVVAAGRVAV